MLEHLKSIVIEFNDRFEDLKNMEFPQWVTHPFLSPLEEIDSCYQEEIFQIMHNDFMHNIYKSQGILMWLNDEVQEKYLNIAMYAQSLLIHFPSSYLVECSFSSAIDFLSKKRNRLEITKRGDLRLKLSKMKPRIKELVKNK